MKISKRTREQAALICAIAASGGVWWDGHEPHWTPAYSLIASAIDASNQAIRLATHAWMRAHDGKRWTREGDAEAEALLRTGWTP